MHAHIVRYNKMNIDDKYKGLQSYLEDLIFQFVNAYVLDKQLKKGRVFDPADDAMK